MINKRFVTGAEANLSGDDQIEIALRTIVENNGVAEMQQIYAAVDAVLDQSDFQLSDQGKATLRRLVNHNAVLAGYIYPHDRRNPGWRITPEGRKFLNRLVSPTKQIIVSKPNIDIETFLPPQPPINESKEAYQPISPSEAFDIDEPNLPNKTAINVTRIIRDTKVSDSLKLLYNNKCQLCGLALELVNRHYSEVHHLQPLGGNHNGPDIENNMIVVCPNHHVELDYGAIAIDPDTCDIIQKDGCRIGKIIVLNGHSLNRRYLEYHIQRIFLGQLPEN